MDWNTIVTTIVSVLASTAFAYFFAQLSSYTKLRKERELAKARAEKLESSVKLANGTLDTLVDYLNLTIVNQLKSLSADGRLTPDECEQIHEAAKLSLYGTLTEETMGALKTVYGDALDSVFDKWIEISVERAKRNGVGISSTEARGIAMQSNLAAEKKQEILQSLRERVETVVSTYGQQ